MAIRRRHDKVGRRTVTREIRRGPPGFGPGVVPGEKRRPRVSRGITRDGRAAGIDQIGGATPWSGAGTVGRSRLPPPPWRRPVGPGGSTAGRTASRRRPPRSPRSRRGPKRPRYSDGSGRSPRGGGRRVPRPAGRAEVGSVGIVAAEVVLDPRPRPRLGRLESVTDPVEPVEHGRRQVRAIGPHFVVHGSWYPCRARSDGSARPENEPPGLLSGATALDDFSSPHCCSNSAGVR